MRRWGTVSSIVTAAVVALLPAAASEPIAQATAGVFDPTFDAFAEPILDRIAGDIIPVDAAGLGGSMFDRLPQDDRTAVEREIEADVIAAMNWERAQRGLWPYIYSDHVSAVLNRWVRMMSSDADDYPDCPGVGCTPSVRHGQRAPGHRRPELAGPELRR